MNALHRLRPLFLAALLVGLAGCDLLFPEVGERTVTLEVDSEPATRVLVVTSRDFFVGVDNDTGEEVLTIFEADSAWVTPLFEGTYVVGLSDAGFYAQTAESEDSTAVVSLRVLVDGEESYFDEAVLTGNGLRYYFRRQ